MAGSIFVVYFRLRPILKLGFVPGRMQVTTINRNDTSRAKLNFALMFLSAMIPLLLVYLLPFSYWVILIYFLIACWPLANIEFYVVLRFIRKRFNVEFLRVRRYRSVLGEKYLVATGYTVVIAPMKLKNDTNTM
ncbi:MAG: hypothetical protein QW453_01400 [Thermoprotei archaeon]